MTILYLPHQAGRAVFKGLQTVIVGQHMHIKHIRGARCWMARERARLSGKWFHCHGNYFSFSLFLCKVCTEQAKPRYFGERLWASETPSLSLPLTRHTSPGYYCGSLQTMISDGNAIKGLSAKTLRCTLIMEREKEREREREREKRERESQRDCATQLTCLTLFKSN